MCVIFYSEKKKGKGKGVPKPDELAPRGSVVFGEYDCMLNQTNIGQNNNKFYRIQVLQSGGSYSLWTHWGRVGERGQFSNKPMGGNSASAVSAFEKQFKSKTSNDWNKRDKFQVSRHLPPPYSILHLIVMLVLMDFFMPVEASFFLLGEWIFLLFLEYILDE